MDRETWVHVEWLGYAQPVGLVVTPQALLSAGCVPERNVAEQQLRLIELVGERAQVEDLKGFLVAFLGWKDSIFQAPLEHETTHLAEYKETLAPDFVANGIHIKQVPNGVALDDAPPDDFSGWNASEQTRFERLLRETRMPVGILSNGHLLRLVYAPRGETPGHLTFPVSAMTETGGRPLLAALLMLLHSERLFFVPEAKRLPAILAESRKYQNEVSTALSKQVLEALHILLRGFEEADAHAKGRLLDELRRAEHRSELSAGLLSVLLRLIFLLYAEDKGLMPASAIYTSSYSVAGLYELLRDDAARFPDVMGQRFGAWARLLTLFRLVFKGGGHGDFQLPRRHGELFDPDAYPFLEGRPRESHFQPGVKLQPPRVSDGVVLGVLERLLVLKGERLSYRALDVEQIGSVYESMMGFELEVAEGASVALEPAGVVVNLDALLALSGKARLDFLKDDAASGVTGKTAEAVSKAKSQAELLSALQRRLSYPSEAPLKPGMLYLQPGEERRASGSHYTPRALTEPIVRATLEPMLKGLGEDPTPTQILTLKVCDPAMGSGAFLVETCRYLGDELKDAWLRHRVAPKVPPDEDLTLHARRVVAQRCLYGVDKNPMAVQLAKLSLWLFTLAKNHPFTFLDHALKCGDSLVGLTRTQISRFTWEDDTTSFTTVFSTHIDGLVRRGESLRMEIHAQHDPDDTTQLRDLNETAEASLETGRLLGNLVIAAFFVGGKDKEKKERIASLATKVQMAFNDTLGMRAALRPGDPSGAADLARLNMTLRGLFDEVREGHSFIPERPFHWELEFPEVFGRGRDGFDSFVGNPPFSGKNGISKAGGDEYLPWLQTLHAGAHGNADLSAHFFRRAFELLWEHGTFGLIATNTIAQGDTRATGLQAIVKQGGAIYEAMRSMPWPGLAAVMVSVVHVAKGRDRDAVMEKRLDGKVVPDINSRLRGGAERPDPVVLKANENKSFVGTYVLGMGFVLTPDERAELIKKNKKNAQRIFRYTGGEEINSDPSPTLERYVINFGQMELKEAEEWPDLMKIVREKVKPERDAQKREIRKKYWWRFGETTPALYEALAPLTRCLALSSVSKHLLPDWRDAERVFSHAAIVFPVAEDRWLAVLQSRLHERWVRLLASSMEDRLRYTPSDCFENFPFPEAKAFASLDDIGRKLDEARRAYMTAENVGLTTTYNRLKDELETDEAVLSLRALHEELDRAVLDAYGWKDIEVPPYTALPETFEDAILDRLFALNAERAGFESVSGPAPATAKKPRKPRAPKAPRLL